ncbi:MAG: beta-lactamase family protein [Actinomycetota bacterium]|nr:beta-lactamase family protein [Actinomycetota bacterium]
MNLPEPLAGGLRRRLAETQARARLPSVSAAVARRGDVAFTAGVGDPAPDPDVQYRIGSITKTFTAVLVLQLRDEGLLSLADPLERHLPGTPAGSATVRDLLGHLSGLTREPPGDFWEAVPGRPGAELLAGIGTEELVLPARRAWHYSNLAYGLLGLVVERARRAAYAEVLRARVLDPLGLRRTTYDPVAPYATGYRVHPYADELREEPLADTGAMAPAGQLWSTPTDLVRWGAFLAEPTAEVLAADTVEEMCEPVAIRDPRGWTSGYGLGLQLFRRGERVYAGHGGSMPGYVAGLAVARGEAVAAATMANAWQGVDATLLAIELAAQVLEGDPQVTPWRPAKTPAALRELLGSWWYRGVELVLYVRDGRLLLRTARDVTGEQAAAFVPAGPDRYRGVDGGDRGELLRVRRDGAGTPVVLDLATWLLTRQLDDPRGGP